MSWLVSPQAARRPGLDTTDVPGSVENIVWARESGSGPWLKVNGQGEACQLGPRDENPWLVQQQWLGLVEAMSKSTGRPPAEEKDLFQCSGTEMSR